MRDTRLTLWPEQKSYYPLVNSWADIKNTESIDFSECLGVHSCGLAATLLGLHNLFICNNIHDLTKKDQHLLIDLSDMRKISNVYENKDTGITSNIVKLNFFEHIKTILSPNLLLKYCSSNHSQLVETKYFQCDALSMPVLKFEFNKAGKDRRDAINPVYDRLEHDFDLVCTNYSFRKDQLLSIIHEIAKNSADHSNEDGFIGVDFVFHNKTMKICLLIGDLGPGIYSHMRNIYVKRFPERSKNTGFAEIYKYALTDEITSKDNKGRNNGNGMSHIINQSIALNARLSVFDVRSRIVLTSLNEIINDGPPHNEIWRCSLRLDGKKPFFYYLELEVDSNDRN